MNGILSQPWQHSLTDYGNVVIAVPVLLFAIAWLAHHRLGRTAFALGLNAALAVVATILLKMVSQQTGGAFFDQPWYLTTGAPSGHAAVSAAIYGGIGGLFLARGKGPAAAIGALLALLLMAAVDITRVTLGYHSPGDVGCGIALGGLFAALTCVAAHASPLRWPPMGKMLVGAVAVGLLMHLSGWRFDSTAVL